jgi:PAS domain S-box-containing protein
MAMGTTKYGRELLSVPAIHKNGSRLSIEFRLTLLKDEKGKLLGAAAIMRDVSERWQQERALKERLSTLEAREEEATVD